MSTIVIKADGSREPYSEVKLRSSIHRAGISDELQDQVIKHISHILRPEVSTSEIHKHILEFIGVSCPMNTGKFILKQAIVDLGPSGYPFEKYIGAVLSYYGYTTQTNMVLDGHCVSHEVDVVAQKEGKKYMIECKFHHLAGAKSDVKVALYVKSRFDDLALAQGFSQGWLVSNTKCTKDALQYANCAGLKILSWGYPPGENLQDLIERSGLYPITCLATLPKKLIPELLARNIVLCRDLLEQSHNSLQQLGASEKEEHEVLNEARCLTEKHDWKPVNIT